MIIPWFTQFNTRDASCHQYNKETKRLVRIRLELGRISSGVDGGAPKVMVGKNRFVGFSETRISDNGMTSQQYKDSFSVKDGIVYANDDPLVSPFSGGKPPVGSFVFDMNPSKSGFHNGNAVTNRPLLPDGVKSEYLSLIANDALMNGASVFKTPEGANASTPKELVDAIQRKVCTLTGADDISALTDDMITAKLSEQIGAIRSRASSVRQSDLEGDLDAFGDIVSRVNEGMSEGDLVPSVAVEDSFGKLDAAISQAKDAIDEGLAQSDLDSILAKIGDAERCLNDYVASSEHQQIETMTEQLSEAQKGLADVKESAYRWEFVDQGYEKIQNLQTLEQYDEEIGTEDIEVYELIG